MPKIVISYRREDTAGVTGRLYDRLRGHYGRDAVFQDIDAIPPGIDFRGYIDEALQGADVLLCVMSDKWLGKRRKGVSRIMDPADPVRVEIEAALRKKIPVVPILVDGMSMPEASELPDTLQDFRFRNALLLSQLHDFDAHANRIIERLDRLLGSRPGGVTASPASPGKALNLQPAGSGVHTSLLFWVKAAIVLLAFVRLVFLFARLGTAPPDFGPEFGAPLLVYGIVPVAIVFWGERLPNLVAPAAFLNAAACVGLSILYLKIGYFALTAEFIRVAPDFALYHWCGVFLAGALLIFGYSRMSARTVAA
jgi:hypothetical protein